MPSEQFRLIDLISDICAGKNIPFRSMNVAADIMNSDISPLTLDHTVKACIDFMKNRRVRHAPVVDIPSEGEKRPYFIGVVSQRDVLRLNSPDVRQLGQEKADRRALRQLLVQIVARKPKAASPETPISEVIMTMLDNHADVMPVLAEEQLVGIITTTDFLKLFTRLDDALRRICPELDRKNRPTEPVPRSSAEIEVLLSWALQTVRKIMTEQIVCLTPKDDLDAAIKLLQQEEIRHILITNEQAKLLGVVSDRDILRHLPFAGRRPLLPSKKFRAHLFKVDPKFVNLKLPLERVMTRKVTSVLPSCRLFDAAMTLRDKKVNSLPVIDEQEKLCGILTTTDLMQTLLALYELSEKCCA